MRALFFQCTAQKLDIFGNLHILAAELFDPAHPVHDGGVIAPTETTPDFRQRPRGHLLAQEHRHLTGPGIDAQAFRADDHGVVRGIDADDVERFGLAADIYAAALASKFQPEPQPPPFLCM